MQAFTIHEGLVAPLDRANVDTDAIIPKQYLKSIRKSGFGPFLFDDLRYLDAGGLDVDVADRREDPDFVLNQSPWRDASILLARENFGCGSSREHAVWALENYGFRAVIAPSFADIFYNNCFKNGVLPIALGGDIVDRLFEAANAAEGLTLRIDLQACEITRADGGEPMAFQVDAKRRENMLEGLDHIGETLKQADAIRAYEAKRRESRPWLFREL